MAIPMSVFKVSVEYEQDAHPPQILAVTKNKKIRTAADAVAHVQEVIEHRDHHTGEIYKAINVRAVSDKPFDVKDAPVVVDLNAAAKVVVTP